MNWSITGEAAIAMHKFSNRRNEEEEKHKEEFDDENKYSNNNASNHTALLFTYWPHKVYDGFFISTGGKIHLNGIADCTLKIGYCMKIYKWITLSAGYGADLIGSYQSDRLIGDGIEICINIRI